MLDITKLLEEIKASPYEECVVRSPHTGRVAFEDLGPGSRVEGPRGSHREKPGTKVATIERENNVKPLHAPRKGEVVEVATELAGAFVEAGTPLMKLRHFLSKEEVLDIILKKTLFLFKAPERAKYYFVPTLDKKIKASGPGSVGVQSGMELFIMSRMKREAPVFYDGPEGVIYAVYFQHNDVVDLGAPLIGVCPPEELCAIQDVVIRVENEWEERE